MQALGEAAKQGKLKQPPAVFAHDLWMVVFSPKIKGNW